MTSGHWPYRDFFDEYPPLAQPLFVLVRLLPGTFTSTFRATMALCGLRRSCCSSRPSRRSRVASPRGRGRPRRRSRPLLVGPVFLNTYDLFPALLHLAAL